MQRRLLPCLCGLASRAYRFLLPLLLQGERPLKEGQGRWLALAVPSRGLRRFPSRELDPGEQGLPALGGFPPADVDQD